MQNALQEAKMEQLKKQKETKKRLIDILEAKIEELELHSFRLLLSKHHPPGLMIPWDQ